MKLNEMYPDRHPSVTSIAQYLDPNPNLKHTQMDIALDFQTLASNLLDAIDDSPELTAGLRKLLEAKDCFIRASLNLMHVDYRDR